MTRRRVSTLLFALVSASATAAQESEARHAAELVLVVGASGTPEYREAFGAWAERWEQASMAGAAETRRIGPGATASDQTDRTRLQSLIASLERGGSRPLWLVFLGHGTYDRVQAKFNLRGPDLAASELAGWLEPIERPTAIVLCAASSGAFVGELSRPGRVVVTATRSGNEYSYSRFGAHLSAAVLDPAADLDKDQQVSLLEAFLFASSRVTEFYEGEARLATEHALIDDNGDGLGTPASWFRGVRSTRRPEAGRLADGVYAHQRHLVPSARDRAIPASARRERDELELSIEELRARKEELSEVAYYAALEELMLRLARLYERLAAAQDEAREDG